MLSLCHLPLRASWRWDEARNPFAILGCGRARWNPNSVRETPLEDGNEKQGTRSLN